MSDDNLARYDDIPCVLAHVTQSREGDVLEAGDEFAVAFADHVWVGTIDEVVTEGDDDE